LGLDRARAVYKVLNAGSMQDFRNEREQPVFGISSYADERPSDKTQAAKNRRVELRFVLAFQPNDNSTKGPSSTLKKNARKRALIHHHEQLVRFTPARL
jgi:hypothetical protein